MGPGSVTVPLAGRTGRVSRNAACFPSPGILAAPGAPTLTLLPALWAVGTSLVSELSRLNCAVVRDALKLGSVWDFNP